MPCHVCVLLLSLWRFENVTLSFSSNFNLEFKFYAFKSIRSYNSKCIFINELRFHCIFVRLASPRLASYNIIRVVIYWYCVLACICISNWSLREKKYSMRTITFKSRKHFRLKIAWHMSKFMCIHVKLLYHLRNGRDTTTEIEIGKKNLSNDRSKSHTVPPSMPHQNIYFYLIANALHDIIINFSNLWEDGDKRRMSSYDIQRCSIQFSITYREKFSHSKWKNVASISENAENGFNLTEHFS